MLDLARRAIIGLEMNDLLRFSVPRFAADAIRIETLQARAVQKGVPDSRFSFRDCGGTYDITCSREIAIDVVEDLQAVAAEENHPTTLTLECAVVAARVLEMLHPHTGNGHGPRTGSF